MADANPSPPFSRREFQRWLHVPAGAKPQIYEQVLATTEINSLTYWLEIFFASGIAAFGLVQSSPAVMVASTPDHPIRSARRKEPQAATVVNVISTR